MKSHSHLRTLSLFFLIICFAWSANTYAQNCSKINTWLDKAESYAVGIDINILDEYTIMKLTSPAFHNEHFKPVFVKNYADLSDSDKEKIKSELLSCSKDKPFVTKGLVTGFEKGNMTYSWDRQVKAINNSTVEENDRIFKYESKIRARNRAQQERVAQQQEAYNKQRAAARTRSRRGTTPVQRNPNAYNTSPKERINVEADYRREAVEMRTILAAIKGNSAPKQEFWDYNNRILMEKVYNGNFEGFPLGLKDMQEQNLMGGFSKVNAIKKYERYLLIYLEYFSKHCASKKPSDYKRVKIQYEVIKTQHNVSSSDGFTKPEIYYMEPYFEDDFRRMHKVLSNAAPIDAIWMLASGAETGLDFEPDLKTLFSKHKCESPIIRQFETNLYLASKGKSSLQKLLPFHK